LVTSPIQTGGLLHREHTQAKSALRAELAQRDRAPKDRSRVAVRGPVGHRSTDHDCPSFVLMN
jgi:hypothetical protein